MIEELRGRFPVKNVQPYGECIIVPAREFQHDWEVSLEGEGHRTFLNAYNGELAFFVRLKKSKPRIFSGVNPKPSLPPRSRLGFPNYLGNRVKITWPIIEKYRGRLPSGEESFHTLIYGILKAKGYPRGARVKIVRPQAKAERRGFHLVFLGYVSEYGVTVERRSSRDFGESKAIPNLPWSRQPFWQSDPRRDRRGGRFHKRG